MLIEFLLAALAAQPAQTGGANSDGPIARARVWTTIEERDLVPEGTAWDPLTRTVLVGSLHKHKIVAIGPDGRVRDLVRPGAYGLASVCGIHVDPARRLLWVTSNPRYDQPSDTTPSILFALDPRTGALRSQYRAPGTGHFLNDLTTGPDGTVYLTDTRAGGVWIQRPGRRALERFEPAASLTGPNGITIDSDGRRLFIAHEAGIEVVTLSDQSRYRLTAPDGIDPRGIDGLAFDDGALIAHQGEPSRVVRYQLDPERRRIVSQYFYELRTKDSDGSTTGEIVGDDYVFIGNSQIDRMNAGTIDSARMDPVRIYRVPKLPRADELVAVSLSGRDSVAVFDGMTLERVATLRVGKGPHEIATSPDGSRAYVADAGDTSVTVITAGRPPSVVATWYLPDTIRVHDVAVSADGSTVWGVDGKQQLLVGLDGRTGRLRSRIRISKPGGWMIEPDGPGGTLVIGNLEGGAVTLVSPSNGRQTVLEATQGEIDAAPSPDGRQVWSINIGAGRVTVFENGRMLDRLPVGKNGSRVSFTRDGRRAVAVAGGDSVLVVFDARTRSRIGSVYLPAGPKVLALSRDGRRAYVTHPEKGILTMVDLASIAVLRSTPVAGEPDGVAVLGEAAPAGAGSARKEE
jgi:DNA-binding beta-propeller fold protein YncE